MSYFHRKSKFLGFQILDYSLSIGTNSVILKEYLNSVQNAYFFNFILT